MIWSYQVAGSIRMAHHDGCGLLRFDVAPGFSVPDVGDQVHVSDPDGCEAWGAVTEVVGPIVTFKPDLGSAP